MNAPHIRRGQWVIATLKSGSSVYDRITSVKDGGVLCLGDPDVTRNCYHWDPEKEAWVSPDGTEARLFPHYEVFSFLEDLIDDNTASLEVYDGCTEPTWESAHRPFFIKANWNNCGEIWASLSDTHRGVNFPAAFPLLWGAVERVFKKDPSLFKNEATTSRSRRTWDPVRRQNVEEETSHSFPVWAPQAEFEAAPGDFVIEREVSVSQIGGGILVPPATETFPAFAEMTLTTDDGEVVAVFSPLYLLYWAVLSDDLKDILDFISSGHWSDEWAQCDECFSAVRTQPDSYGWTRSYVDWEGQVVCHECITADPGPFVDHLLDRIREEEGDQPIALPTFMDLDQLPEGWLQLPVEMDSGLYRSNRCDDPHKLNAALYEMGVLSLWQITDQGQFETEFCCYVRHKDFEEGVELDPSKLEELVDLVNQHMAPGAVARNMEAALKSVSLTPAPPGHVKVVKIHADTESHSAEERDVPRAEFIDGIKENP